MKKIIFFISIITVVYISGCKHAVKHESTTHTHENEDTPHTHENNTTSNTGNADEHLKNDDEIKIKTLKRGNFRDILKTTGKILPARENVRIYFAQSSGFIY